MPRIENYWQPAASGLLVPRSFTAALAEPKNENRLSPRPLHSNDPASELAIRYDRQLKNGETDELFDPSVKRDDLIHEKALNHVLGVYILDARHSDQLILNIMSKPEMPYEISRSKQVAASLYVRYQQLEDNEEQVVPRSLYETLLRFDRDRAIAEADEKCTRGRAGFKRKGDLFVSGAAGTLIGIGSADDRRSYEKYRERSIPKLLVTPPFAAPNELRP